MKITIDEVELEFDASVELSIVGKNVTIKAAAPAHWISPLLPLWNPYVAPYSPWNPYVAPYSPYPPGVPYCGDSTTQASFAVGGLNQNLFNTELHN